MVLADFATMSAIKVAKELKIPCIINVPGAIWAMGQLCSFGVVSPPFENILWRTQGPVELIKNLSISLAIPFCSAVFLATRSFLETKLIFKMFYDLVPEMKSALDAHAFCFCFACGLVGTPRRLGS